MKLKGKPLDHYRDGLSQRFADEREGDWKAALRKRIAHLDGLPDDVFEQLGEFPITQSIDAHQGFGSHDEWLGWIGAYLPRTAPVLDMTRCVYPAVHFDGHTVPCIVLRSPYDGIKLNYRGLLERDHPDREAQNRISDGLGNYPSTWWRPRYDRDIGYPMIRAGWWSGGKAYYLVPFPAGGPAKGLTQDFPAFFLPSADPGWLRVQVVNWATTDRAETRSEGAWSDPLWIDRLYLNEYVCDAMLADDPSPPDVPIGVCGSEPYEYADDDVPVPFDSDWPPPPPPAGAAQAARVSADAKAWLEKRVKRYGGSSTGRYWRELLDAMS